MFEELDAVLDNAWGLLGQGVTSRKHGFHHAAVATIGMGGQPRIRTVILRAAEQASTTVRFHTDSRSSKCADIAQDPRISMVLYDEPSRVQLRLEGVASLHRDDELADTSWSLAQPMSKITYGIMPAPGLVIQAPNSFTMPAPQSDAEGGREHFVVVKVSVQTLQWLYLKHDGQRCAVFDFAAGTQVWTVPS